MEIKQSFTVARPLAEVWALFQDVPTVATCMPSARNIRAVAGTRSPLAPAGRGNFTSA